MLGCHRCWNYLTKTLKQLSYFPTSKTEQTFLKNTESLSKETEGIKKNQVEMLEMKKFNN